MTNENETITKTLQETKGDATKTQQTIVPPPTVTPPLISCGKREYSVLRMLAGSYSKKTIYKELGISPSALSVYLNRLMRKNYIDRNLKLLINFQCLKVPQENTTTQTKIVGYDDCTGNKGVDDLKKTYVSFGTLRTHNVKTKYNIVSMPDPLVLSSWRVLKLKYNKQYHISYNGMYLILTSKSLIVQLPPIDLYNAQDINETVMKMSAFLINDLENHFSGLKLGDCKYSSQQISPHFAIQNHPFAKWLTDKGLNINEGSVHVDASKPDRVPELEITSSEVPNYDTHDLANAYRKQVLNQMDPKTPLISDLNTRIDTLNMEINALRTNLVDCTNIIKTTLDVQKLTAEQLNSVVKILMPKQDVLMEKFNKNDSSYIN
jgi:DNA-binding CsgD family transcriptional regulator